MSAGIDDPQVVAFQAERRQDTGLVGAGVDADPVGLEIDLFDGGVAVHDDRPVIIVAVEEFVADSEQVGRALAVELDAGSNPRVREQIIARAVRGG